MSLLIKALKKAESENQKATVADDSSLLEQTDALLTAEASDAELLSSVPVDTSAPALADPTPASDAPPRPAPEIEVESTDREPLAFASEQPGLDVDAPAVDIPRHVPPSDEGLPAAPEPVDAVRSEPMALTPVAGDEGTASTALPEAVVPPVVNRAKPLAVSKLKGNSKNLIGMSAAVLILAVAGIGWYFMDSLSGQNQFGNGAILSAPDPSFTPPISDPLPAASNAGANNQSAQSSAADNSGTPAADAEPQAKLSDAALGDLQSSEPPAKQVISGAPVSPDTAANNKAVTPPQSTAKKPARARVANAAGGKVAPKLPPVRFVRQLSARDRKLATLNDAYRNLREGNLDAAKAGYRQALKIDSNLSDAWIGLASIAARQSDPVRAEQYYQRALIINPNDSVAKAGLALLSAATDPVKQESQLRSLAAQQQSDAAVQFALGNALAGQGRWAEAQQAYFEASAADPSQPDYAFNLAISLEQLRQPAAAVTHYRRALQAAQAAPASFDSALARARIAAIAGDNPRSANQQ